MTLPYVGRGSEQEDSSHRCMVALSELPDPDKHSQEEDRLEQEAPKMGIHTHVPCRD